MLYQIQFVSSIISLFNDQTSMRQYLRINNLISPHIEPIDKLLLILYDSFVDDAQMQKSCVIEVKYREIGYYSYYVQSLHYFIFIHIEIYFLFVFTPVAQYFRFIIFQFFQPASNIIPSIHRPLTIIIIKLLKHFAMNTLLLIVLLCFVSYYGQPHQCAFHKYYNSNHYQSKTKRSIHSLLKDPVNPGLNQTHGRGRLLYGESRPSMVITLNTDDFNTIKTTSHGQPQTTTQNLNFVMKAMKVAKKFYESRLKVSTEGTVDIPSLCYDFNPPSTDVSNDISGTDLHIYVRYITDNTHGYGATGVSCQWSPITTYPDTQLKSGRPTVGRIIFNTYQIVDTKPALTNRLFAAITATALHETMHILGFDQSLYDTYLDYTTGNLYSNVTQTVTLNAARTGGANAMMITPSVKAWATQHYGCAGIIGMPLENQQTSGNAVGSHWQRLTAYDEMMTGTELGPQKIISALSFALLKDMGWYGVDDSFNDTTNYGYQKGCSFFYDACYSNSTTFPKYFCNPTAYSGVTQCSSTFTGKAVCSNIAGLMSDGCGLFFQNFNCVDPDVSGDFYQSYTLQSYTTSTLCIKGTLTNTGIDVKYRSRCYPVSCDYTTNTTTFTIGPNTVYCFSNEQGTTKSVTGLDGNIQCPIFEDLCTEGRKICPNWCSQNGFCTRGICNCYSNDVVTYSGADCSISSCTTAGTYYYAATSSCLPSCPAGYYANAQSRTCLPCDSSCDYCRDEPHICTGCVSTPANPKYYDQSTSTCVSSCPSGTFLSVDTCYLCAAACATCENSNTTCTSCTNPAYYLNELAQCGATCTGTYDKYDVISMVCRQTCPNTLYLNGTTCLKCTPKYKIIDVLDNNCYDSCGSGYYTDTPNALCGRCNETCKQCYGKFSQNCTSCWQNGTLKFLHLDMCQTSCPDGFYTQTTLGKCQVCTVQLHCATCTLNGTTVQCVTCKYTYYLQPNKTCKTGCDPTFYRNNWNHTCDPCSNQCRDCNGPYQSSCLNCVSPKYYIKNSTGGYCLAGCPSQGYVAFLSTSCLPCHNTCNTCNSQTSTGCVTCRTGLYLQNQICRYVCSPGKFPDNTTMTCLACNTTCTFCFGSTIDNCTGCQSGFYLNNFTCSSSCPDGQTPNKYNVCDKKTFEEIMRFVGMATLLVIFAFGL